MKTTKPLEIVHSHVCGLTKGVFTEDSMSMGDDMEIHPSGRNDASMVVKVDQFFKSHSEKRMGDNQVATRGAKELPINKMCS